MGKLFQIHEDDLAELERVVPQVLEQHVMRIDAKPVDRKNFIVIQKILTNIRWNYGPARNVEEHGCH